MPALSDCSLKSYYIRTFGCQMNKHDAEAVAGLLTSEGLRPSDTLEHADVIVFLTCCVRENADERLRGQVASLKVLKTSPKTGVDGRTPPIIAVGGCIGQRDGERLLQTLPHVDVVFGTQNIDHLPQLLRSALERRESQEQAGSQVSTSSDATVEVLETSELFAADLPQERERAWHAWLPITQGCNNFCTYCIVPYVRGQERSRPLEDIVAQARGLVADGVREITLLGQNVNSYGRDRDCSDEGEPRFAQALREVAATGIERLGFATSHPKDLSNDTVEVMVSTPAVLPYLHLPVQSGSTKVLKAMNRIYTREEYLALVARVRAAYEQTGVALALSTDIIVGFPGETEEDFADTLSLVNTCAFDQAFTFLYSPREGTPAATMLDQVPADVAQERFKRLVECVQTNALSCNERLVGSTQEVLLEGASKRDDRVLTGRTRGQKVLHLPLPKGEHAQAYAGQVVQARVNEAHTWYLSGEWL